MDFLIFCPPRSRSAWLANFLTYESSYCYHEALAVVENIKELASMKRGEKITGNSDSGLFLFAEEILKALPDAKVVLVKRDKEGVYGSLIGGFNPCTSKIVAELCASASDLIEKAPGVLTINLDDLNKESVCRKIWEFCIPETPFDSERWKMLSLHSTGKCTT